MKIRASKTPLAFACPGSLRQQDGEVVIEILNDAAPLGSAVHEVLAAAVGHQGADEIDARPSALKHGVDPDELARLVRYGLHAWRSLAQYYPNPTTEAELEYSSPAFRLTGHIDVLSVGESWANFLDYKSGFRQPDEATPRT